PFPNPSSTVFFLLNCFVSLILSAIMDVCFSPIRVTGTTCSSSRRSSSQTNNNKKNPKSNNKTPPPPENNNDKPSTTIKRRTGSVPCRKRTEFGYAKDFHEQYSIGKLLGHGQFGYTYVAIHKSNGDRVAVKRLDKSKVVLFSAV
ncbi:unnamed protein product, partial [Brassica rapa subsp. trilocularis]